MTIDLMYLATELTRCIVPWIIVLGIISNLFNILLLTRRLLIHHPCSLYFLAMSITNLFYSSFLLIPNLLADGFQLDITRSSKFLCKLISYFLNFCPTLSIYLLVLASIDRYWVSSIDPERRSCSNICRARWRIGGLVSILAIFFIGALISFDVSSDPLHTCLIKSNELFNQLFSIVLLILYAMVAPCLMIFFGILTIYNTKKVRSNPVYSCGSRRTERQLTRMLFVQVGSHLILTLPFCVVFFITLLPLDLRWTQGFAFTYIICKIPFYLTVTTAFFLHVLSARIYRNEFLRLYRRFCNIINRRHKTSRIIPQPQTGTD